MPAIKSLADYLTTTLETFERNKYDAVGLSQLYPDYEVVKQQIAGRRKVARQSADYETFLRIDAPSSFEKSYVNHPLSTSTHKLFKRVKSTMSKIRVSTTFNDDERALQGDDKTKLVDEIQARLLKMDQEYWEGLENQFLDFDSTGSAFPPSLDGVTYWVTSKSGMSAGDFDPNGGDDPVTAGAGGITKAAEGKWPNATAKFAKISQDDFFDLVQRFLHRVKTKAVVPHPAFTSEMPNRVLYTQEPIQRAVERYLSARNENLAMDAGAYRGAPTYRGIPITIWHAMSSPDSAVRPSTGTCLLLDWETFHYVVHSDKDRKMHGPELLPNIPGQHVVAMETYHLLHNARRDRNLRLVTDTTDLQPDSV